MELLVSKMTPEQFDVILIQKCGKSVAQIKRQEEWLSTYRQEISELTRKCESLKRDVEHLELRVQADTQHRAEIERRALETTRAFQTLCAEKAVLENSLEAARARLASLEMQLEIIKTNVSPEALAGVDA